MRLINKRATSHPSERDARIPAARTTRWPPGPWHVALRSATRSSGPITQVVRTAALPHPRFGSNDASLDNEEWPNAHKSCICHPPYLFPAASEPRHATRARATPKSWARLTFWPDVGTTVIPTSGHNGAGRPTQAVSVPTSPLFGVLSQGFPIAWHDSLPTSGKNRLPGRALFPTSAKNGSVHRHNSI